jgi:hypothetical protein
MAGPIRPHRRLTHYCLFSVFYFTFPDIRLCRLQQGVHVAVLPVVLVALAARSSFNCTHQIRSDHFPSSLGLYSGYNLLNFIQF